MLGFLAWKNHQKMDKATPARSITLPTTWSHASTPTLRKHQCPGAMRAHPPSWSTSILLSRCLQLGTQVQRGQSPQPWPGAEFDWSCVLLVEWGTWETQGPRARPWSCKGLNLFNPNPTGFPHHRIVLFSSLARVISTHTKHSSLMSLFPLFFLHLYFLFSQIK